MSPRYLDALLSYEDRWFYWHPGINPVAMVRAGWQWLAHGPIVSGGSTLPDRLRPRGLLEAIWIDPQTGLRTTPACQPMAQRREVARWPSLLEAWLSGAQR